MLPWNEITQKVHNQFENCEIFSSWSIMLNDFINHKLLAVATLVSLMFQYAAPKGKTPHHDDEEPSSGV